MRTFDTKARAAEWPAGIEADIARGLMPSARAVAGSQYTVFALRFGLLPIPWTPA